MHKIIKISLYFCLSLFVGCLEVEDTEQFIPEEPETPNVVAVTSTSVTIPIKGMSSSRYYGFHLLIGQKPNLSDAEYHSCPSYDTYFNILNLKPNTTYYYQAVVENGLHTVELKGKIKSFTTKMNLNTPVCSQMNVAADNMVSLTAEVPSENGPANILEYGFCISQVASMPNINTSDVVIIQGKGLPSSINGAQTYSFSGKSDVSKLKKGLITYVRSYIKTDKSVSYSEGNSYFFPVSGIHQDRAYVDLGLPSGILWTTANFWGKVPNDSPADYSGYYLPDFYSDDFGDFRKPIFTDAKELYENCTYSTVFIDNEKCAKITSKNNGNAIYIRFQGWWVANYGYRGDGDYGCIWLDSKYDQYWRMLEVSEEDEIGYRYYSKSQYNKCNIRLVLDNENL